MSLTVILTVVGLVLMVVFWLLPRESALQTVRSMRRQFVETRSPDSKPLPSPWLSRMYALLPWLVLAVLSWTAVDAGRSDGSDEAISLGLLVLLGFGFAWMLSSLTLDVIAVTHAFRDAQDDAREVRQQIPEMEPTEALEALDGLLASILGSAVEGKSGAVNS